MSDIIFYVVRMNGAPIDAADMRTQNSALVIQLMWSERRISRIDLSRRTGLSPSTVSLIVNALSRVGLVREVGRIQSARGRRPTLLAFCDDFLHILGVEVGVRHVAVALTNLRGQVSSFCNVSYPMRDDPAGTLAAVGELVHQCLSQSRIPRRRLMGVGIAVPSPLWRGRSHTLSELLYPAWKGVDLARSLHSSLRLPILIDNDANLGALAEHWWGAGRGVQDLTYVKVGAGLGAGHVIGGDLYRGTLGTAGEIGHVSFDPGGEPCICGARGCLATLVGSDALAAQARRVLGRDDADVAAIVRAAADGHPEAAALIQRTARYLGQVIVGSIVNLLSPGLIVLGGEITAASGLLLEPLRKFVGERSWTGAFDTNRIVLGTLGPQTIAVGAATLYLAGAVRSPELFLRERPRD
jgi:predicted NBD/HSP70 family sugar kinase